MFACTSPHPLADPPSNFLSVKEAAALVGRDNQTILRLCWRYRDVVPRKDGRWMVPADLLAATWPEGWLSTGEAAKQFGLTRDQIRVLAERGHVTARVAPGPGPTGTKWLISGEDLAEWLASMPAGHPPDPPVPHGGAEGAGNVVL